MNLHLYDVIQVPNITEKSTKVEPQGKYSFRVHPSASKQQVKDAVEQIFNVKVTKINTMNVSGKWKRLRSKPGRTSDWKKAIVTLKTGQKIDLQAA